MVMALPSVIRIRGVIVGMIEQFRTWSAVIGLMAFGPLMLGFTLVCLVRGELPGKHSVLIAADQPLAFYSMIFFFLCGSLIWTSLSLMVAFRCFRRTP